MSTLLWLAAVSGALVAGTFLGGFLVLVFLSAAQQLDDAILSLNNPDDSDDWPEDEFPTPTTWDQDTDDLFANHLWHCLNLGGRPPFTYLCNKQAGHEGIHVAYDTRGYAQASWENESGAA